MAPKRVGRPLGCRTARRAGSLSANAVSTGERWGSPARLTIGIEIAVAPEFPSPT